MTLPECATYADVERLDGKPAAVVGVYEQVDVRARPRPPAVFDGHAAVRLRDGHLVCVEPVWSPRAVRSEDEVARAEGRSVYVVGVVHLRSPEPPEPAASVIGPCVSDVERVDVR
jgi:hypothetical protein